MLTNVYELLNTATSNRLVTSCKT